MWIFLCALAINAFADDASDLSKCKLTCEKVDAAAAPTGQLATKCHQYQEYIRPGNAIDADNAFLALDLAGAATCMATCATGGLNFAADVTCNVVSGALDAADLAWTIANQTKDGFKSGDELNNVLAGAGLLMDAAGLVCDFL